MKSICLKFECSRYRLASALGMSMIGKIDHRSSEHRPIRWLAYACLLAGAIGLVVASSTWINQVLFYSGIPLLVTAFAWLFPAPSSIVGILFSLYQILRYSLYAAPHTYTPKLPVIVTPPVTIFIPQAIYYLLYGVFLLGCAIHLYLGIMALRRAPKITSNTNRGIRLVARIATLGTLLISILVFLTIDEAAVAFTFNVWAIIASGIAWFWPGAGGMLAVLVGGWSLYDLLTWALWPKTQSIYSVLFSIFMLGGVLYLFLAWRSKSHKASDIPVTPVQA